MNVIKIMKNPVKYIYLIEEKLLMGLSDENYIKMIYKHRFGKKLNLKNPQTYNEKLQWLKLNDRNPLYTTLVDKYLVKKYVADKIGEKYVIPLLGVWDNFDDIDYDKLPNQFVLKTNHGCGGIVVCKDKEHFDINNAKNIINKSLKRNYYKLWREWPYKRVEKKIFAEKYMVDESGFELKDYKFFCFDGKVQLMFIARGRTSDEITFDFYDRDFEHLDIKQGHPNSPTIISKPDNYEKMVELAEKLSKGIPHVRVDFYNVNGKIYFGEMTFYHFAGIEPFRPNDWDWILGEYIDLSLVKPSKNIME